MKSVKQPFIGTQKYSYDAILSLLNDSSKTFTISSITDNTKRIDYFNYQHQESYQVCYIGITVLEAHYKSLANQINANQLCRVSILNASPNLTLVGTNVPIFYIASTINKIQNAITFESLPQNEMIFKISGGWNSSWQTDSLVLSINQNSGAIQGNGAGQIYIKYTEYIQR